MNSKQLKLVSAGIGTGAVIAMGALGAAFSPTPAGTGTVSEGPEITLGETITSTTGQTEVATSLASPEVTAEALPPPP
ncbi:MAG TPA: hypothetical protein VHI10_00525 [Mycobacterium sp.]|nr:hypothetical protein [Mycobacterium sp.]